MTRAPHAIALLCCLLIAISAVSVSAQDQTDPRVEEARRLFERGNSEFDQRLYVAAMRSFEESWNIMNEVQHPRAFLVRYNWARALEEAGAFDRAATMYEHYLAEGGNTEENRAEVERRVVDLRARRAVAEGSVGDETGRADAALANAQHGADGSISPVGPVVIGVGAASLIAGAILGGVALSEDAAFVDACPSLTDCDPSLRDRYESMRLMAGATDVLLFGGAAVAVVGIVLTVLLREPAPTATAACSTDGCGVFVQGSF